MPPCWQDGTIIDVPIYQTPVIIATVDSRFVISWIDERILPDLNTDIGYAVYNSDGTELSPLDDLKNGNPGFDRYGEPRLLELSGQRLLITYSIFEPSSGKFTPGFEVYSIDPNDYGKEIQIDESLSGMRRYETLTV
ncbi:MAG: hypothetical protein HC806_04075 [Anaerolineae bacterium]|nr:hypothetical protein [Anaerolineae bacterium]